MNAHPVPPDFGPGAAGGRTGTQEMLGDRAVGRGADGAPSGSGEPAEPLLPGDPVEIGGLRLVGRLTPDARGVRYLAESPAGVSAIVCVPSAEWAADPRNRGDVARVLVAARRAAGVSGTVRLLGARLEPDPPFLAWENPGGTTLRALVRRSGPLSAWALERLAVQTLTTIEALHGCRVEHGDLTPDTVVMCDGEALLRDVGFGAGHPQDGHPQDGSDLFGWAATVAFAGSGSDSDDLSGLPSPLRDVVRECLEPGPARRPTARQALARLGAATPTSSGIGSLNRRSAPPPLVTGGQGTAQGTAGRHEATPAGPGERAWVERGRAVALATAAWFGRLPRWRRITLAAVVPVVASATVGLLVSLALVSPTPSAAPDPQSNNLIGPASPSDCLRERHGSLSAVRWDNADGCYGFMEAGDGFGRDGAARDLQSRLLAWNDPSRPSSLTLVWFGSLTCPGYRDDGTCADGRIYDTERSELTGLLLARRRERPGGENLRFVIANAGANMRHAEEVAKLLVARRADLGRAVIVGGGESRAETHRAVEILLGAGLPFVAPSMSADLGAAGRPFVDLPGYLQISRPNREQAQVAVDFVARRTPAPSTRQVIVFHVPKPGDDFTASLAADVVAEAAARPRTAVPAPRTVSDVAQLPASVCRSASSGKSPDQARKPGQLPAAVFYADRWSTFPAFARALTARCGAAGPAMVVAGTSVARFMGSDESRSAVRAPWPLAYTRIGRHCSELEVGAADPTDVEAVDLLSAIRAELGACAPGAGTPASQIGERVSLFWDAVTLARQAVRRGGGLGEQAGRQVLDVDVRAVNGRLSVRGGQVAGYADLGEIICARTVDRSIAAPRSAAMCDTVFGRATTSPGSRR